MIILKFTFASDLHLGVTPYGLEQRAEDFWFNWNKIIDYTRQRGYKYLLLGGDIFDSRVITPDVLNRFVSSIKNQPFKIICTSGNHDRQTHGSMSWLQYLNSQGLIIYVDGEYYLQDESIYIYGFESLKRMNKWMESNKIKKPSILLLHEMIDGYLPLFRGIEKTSVNWLDFNFVGLGHAHLKYEIPEFHIYNPGSIERTSISDLEQGFAGFYDVNLNSFNVEYIKLDIRPISKINIDISSAKDEAEVFSMIKNKVESEPSKNIVDVILHGTTTIIPDLKTVQQTLNKSMFFVKVRNHATPPDVQYQGAGEDYESNILKEMLGEQDAKRVLDLKKILHTNPTVEEIREIFRK